MKILDFVRPEFVLADVKGLDKRSVLEELAAHLGGAAEGVDREALLRVLADRERLASTAIGEGVAIPHGKLPVPRLLGCVGVSRRGVDFDSMDGRPTHIFFVLVAPENSTGMHLKALARISRLFKDPDFRNRLMQAKDATDMFRVLADEDARY